MIAVGLTALCVLVFVVLLQLRLPLLGPGSAASRVDLSDLALGLETALSPTNVLVCLLGVALGTAVGVLPGIGPTATVALLLPITFNFDPIASLIMLAGIYYGAQYGGSTTAILINIPGESSAAVTALDGHEMAKQGRAGPALATAALGSFFAGTVATVLVALFAPPLSSAALKFGAAEYFSPGRARPDRVDRPGEWVAGQGVGDDRAGSAARHGRARTSTPVRRGSRSAPASCTRASTSWPWPSACSASRRSSAPRGRRDAAVKVEKASRVWLSRKEFRPDHPAGAAGYRDGLGAGRPAGRRARAGLVHVVLPGEAAVEASRAVRPRAPSRAWPGRSRPTTPRRRRRSSRCSPSACPRIPSWRC